MSKDDDFWPPYLVMAILFAIEIYHCISDYEDALAPLTGYRYKNMGNIYILFDRIGGQFLVVGILLFFTVLCIMKVYFIWKKKR